MAVAIAVAVAVGPTFLLRDGLVLSRWFQVGIRYRQVVDGFYVGRCGSEVLDAGCEAFCSGEEEVLWEDLVRFQGVVGGEEALLGG